MQLWIEQVNDSAEKAIAREGGAREILMAWFEDYCTRLTGHKGVAAKVTTALDDEQSPIFTKCQTYKNANQRVFDALVADGAARPGVDPVQVLRLIGGVATLADQGGMTVEQVRPMLEVVADGVLR